MKICPRCRRTYDDSIDFCLRDGKPLVTDASEGAPEKAKADISPAPPPPPRPTPSSASPVLEAIPPHDDPFLRTGLIKLPVAPAPSSTAPQKSPPRIKAWTPGQPPAAGATSPGDVGSPFGSEQTPPSSEKGSPFPKVKPWSAPTAASAASPQGKATNKIQPWVPGQTREASVFGVKLTVPVGFDGQVPPWDVSSTSSRTVEEQLPGNRLTAFTELKPALITPDMPLPPEERKEAEPVGDETVLLSPSKDEELDLEDSLEVEETEADDVLPLVVRRTRRSLFQRPFDHILDVPPPFVDDTPESSPLMAIYTEDEFVPPLEGDDPDADPAYVIYYQGRKWAGSGAPSPSQERTEGRRLSNAAYLGMVSFGVAAILLIAFLFVSKRPSLPMHPEGSTPQISHVDSSPSPVGLPGVASPGPAASSEKPLAPATSPTPPPPPRAEPKPAEVPPAIPSVPKAPAAAPDAPPPQAAAPSTVPMAPGALVVTSTPTGAQVFLDDQPVGETPLTLRAAPGKHRLRLTRDGYRQSDSSVTLVSNETGKVGIDLEAVPVAAPSQFLLVVSSNIIGADVFVDGVSVGKTPLTRKLPTGVHSIKVAPDGKPAQEKKVEVGQDVAPEHREVVFMPF